MVFFPFANLILRPTLALAATGSPDLPLREAIFPLLVSAVTGMSLTALADLIVQVSGNDMSNDSDLYRCNYLMSLTDLTRSEKWKRFTGKLVDRGRAVNLPRLLSFALFGLCLKVRNRCVFIVMRWGGILASPLASPIFLPFPVILRPSPIFLRPACFTQLPASSLTRPRPLLFPGNLPILFLLFLVTQNLEWVHHPFASL
jgi:hypothetical protein